MSRKEGVKITTRHIEEKYINSYGRLVASAIDEFFEMPINCELDRNMIKLKSLINLHHVVLQHFT